MHIKHSDQIRRCYEKISPNFPPELEEQLHTVLKECSITKIINHAQQILFKNVIDEGVEFNKKYARQKLREPGFEFDLLSTFMLGDYVYSEIMKVLPKKILLTNDIAVLPNGENWKFTMRSLSKQKVKGSLEVYYSATAPEVNLDGSELTIAYTPHAIQQIHRRTKNEEYSYGALGDLFSFLYENNYYEFVKLKNGEPSYSIFALCGDESAIQFNIVKAIFGVNYFPDEHYYYRLGYLPVEQHNGFAICKTLLCPGFLQTPEYEKLEKSGCNSELLKRAIENERDDSMFTYDLPLIKKMHETGIDQVKILDKNIYTFTRK